MKSNLSSFRIFLLCCLLLSFDSAFVFGQNGRKNDVIITKGNERIEAIILEVDESVVKYRKVSDPEGPVFSLNKTDISSILYGNGEVEKLDKSAEEEYFKPDSTPPPVIYKQRETNYNNSRGISGRSNEQLRSNYNLYLKKSSSYRKMGLIGASAGLLFTVVGVVKINQAENYYNTYGYYRNDTELGVGALLFFGGIFGGIPLTVIGLVKNKSYTKKALQVKDELRRRSQPLSFRLNPGYNPQTNTGYLSLKMTF